METKIFCKKAWKIFFVMTVLLFVFVFLAFVYMLIVNIAGDVRINMTFFLTGLFLSLLLPIFDILIFKNCKNKIVFLQKLKIIFCVVSFAAMVLLIIGIIDVYCFAKTHVFPQAIGFDQTAFLLANYPIIFLSCYAIIVNIFSWIILFCITPENQKQIKS